MNKMKLSLWMYALVMFAASLLSPGYVNAAKTMYIGGTMSLTGPYSQDSAAMLVAFENYVKYVNETKNLAPWRTEKFPADITLEVLWRDDELKPAGPDYLRGSQGKRYIGLQDIGVTHSPRNKG